MERVKVNINIILFGLSILGMTWANLATARTGWYASGYFGQANSHLDKPLDVSIFDWTSQSDTFPCNSPHEDETCSSIYSYSSDTTALAGGVSLGYFFTDNFALEVGYKHLGTSTVKLTRTSNFEFNELPTIEHSPRELRRSLIDLLVQFNMPIANTFAVYTKFGLASVNQKTVIGNPDEGPGNGGEYYEDNGRLMTPTFGAGLSYSLRPSANLELSWMHLVPKKPTVGEFANVSSNGIRAPADFISLGVTVHFGQGAKRVVLI